MKDKKDPDENWAGKGFSRRNEESAPEPKDRPDPDDPDNWVYE